MLQANDGENIHVNSNINLAGGVLESNGNFNRFLGTGCSRVQWTGSGVASGFSAYGGDLTVRLNDGEKLTWDSGSFVPDGCQLLFGSQSATDNVTFVNAIDLGGSTRSIVATANEGNTNEAILTGALSNGSLAVGDSTHTGKIRLTGANTYTGSTQVNGGTLILDGSLASPTVTVSSGATFQDSNGGLNDSTALTVNGTFNLGANDKINTLAGSGTINLQGGTLTVDNGTFSGVVAGSNEAYGLTKTTSGTLTLSGANTYVGPTQISAGTLALTGSLASHNISIASGATLTDNNSGLSADASLTNNGTLAIGANETISSLTNTGTINGSGYTLTASSYSLEDGSIVNSNLGAGTLTSTGTTILNGTSAASTLNVPNGTLTLGASERILDSAAVTLAGTLVLGGNEKISSLHGSGNLSIAQGTITVDSGTFSGVISGADADHGLTKLSSEILTLSGVNTYVGATQVNEGTLLLEGSLQSSQVMVASGASLEDVNSGLSVNAALTNNGTFTIGANDTVASLVNNGTINGTGKTLTAATYALNNGSIVNANLGTGALTCTGDVQLNGTSAASTVNISGGTTNLGSAERLLDATALTVNGTLVLGGAEKVASLSGGGNISVELGTLSVDSGTFSGVISGTNASYGLTKASSGTLTLSGNHTYTGPTQIEAGTMVLTGSLASEIIDIESSATLSDPNGGLVSHAVVTNNGNLILTNNETVKTLNGSGSVNITGSTLTLSDGTFSGVITGNGNLTKDSANTLTLSGNNTYEGVTQINAGSVVLTGSLASDNISIASDATLIDSNGGLSSSTALNNAGTFTLGANETIASLVNYGIINGSDRTLTATTYTLNDGSVVHAKLGTGTMTTNGDVELHATSAASVVNINAGSTLSLIGEQLLSDQATVNVAGALTLGGGDQTIDKLNGTGNVNVNAYQLVVKSGGNFNGNISASGTQLTAQGGEFNLSNNTVQTDIINVASGGVVNLTGSTATANNVNLANNSSLAVDPNSVLTAGVITTGQNSVLTVSNSSSLNYSMLTGLGRVDTGTGDFVNQSLVRGFLTFSGDFTNNGTLKPGASPGQITILGNYTESSELDLELETTTPATGHDQIRVGGTVTVLPGSILDVQAYNNVLPARGNVYQVISDLSGNSKRIHGKFDSVLFDRDGAGPQAGVHNAAVVLDLATGRLIATGLNADNSRYEDLGTSNNQRRAAGAIFKVAQVGECQIDTDTLEGTLALQIIDSSGSPSADLALYTPEYYGAMADYAFMGDRSLMRGILNRASPFHAQPTQAFDRRGVFGGYLGNHSQSPDKAKMGRHDFFLGADLTDGIGFSLGAAIAKVYGDIKCATGTSSVDGATAIVYARKSLGESFIALTSVSGSALDHKLRRQTMNGYVKGISKTHGLSTSLGLQYKGWKLSKFNIAPRGHLIYSVVNVDRFSEEGAIDALRCSGCKATLLTADVGFSALMTTQWLRRTLNLELLAGVEQVITRDKTPMNLEVIGQQAIAYSIEFAKPQITSMTYGVNVGYQLAPRAVLDLGYGGKMRGRWDHSVNASLRFEF